MAVNFPAATVTFELSATSDLVTGTHGTNTLRGFRLVKPGCRPLQRVTVAFENDVALDRTTTPGGAGYATGELASNGLLPLRGFLGDGQPLTLDLSFCRPTKPWFSCSPTR